MKTTHTPGPWEARDEGNSIAILSDHACFAIARINTVSTASMGEDMPHASNARLIAAAPAMLQALRECVTSDNARCMQDNGASEMVEAMERRLNYITAIAETIIHDITGE